MYYKIPHNTEIGKKIFKILEMEKRRIKLVRKFVEEYAGKGSEFYMRDGAVLGLFPADGKVTSMKKGKWVRLWNFKDIFCPKKCKEMEPVRNKMKELNRMNIQGEINKIIHFNEHFLGLRYICFPEMQQGKKCFLFYISHESVKDKEFIPPEDMQEILGSEYLVLLPQEENNK